jgi:hypothetical protein
MVYKEQQRILEEYLAKIAITAMEAEQLRKRVDGPYREILDKEIEGYHELIALWRQRLAKFDSVE